MSEQPERLTHAGLVERAAKWLRNTKHCGVVLTERDSYAGEIPDAIGWNNGFAHVVECKVSRSDFLADRHKRWRREPSRGMGLYRWFFAPSGLLRADEMPALFGLVEVIGRSCRVAKPAEEHQQHNRNSEILLLTSELRRYQLHGITYPPLPKVERRQAVTPAHTDLGPLMEPQPSNPEGSTR